GNTPTDSDDDIPKDGVFSTNSFDDENTDNEEDGAPDYNNMDHTIEAARTMLADSKLPTMFWTEAISTACYVLNRVSITNPHNKTPYELISGKVPQISHLKPFGLLGKYCKRT
ncbi:putative ribonuclease H-like domain-containing protein, partial [Tanacetum coccineum]